MENIKMPAGQYYIGDLCYVLRHKWDEVCRLTICGNECFDGKFTLSNGANFVRFVLPMNWRNEVSRLTCFIKIDYGNDIGVDSGTIGCIETKYLDAEKLELCKEYSLVYDFKEEFECYNEDGNMTFGVISIMTEEDPLRGRSL